ncbi:MAG: glycosyl hydrolase 53 family protein [Candidatus Omnitrophota bacterium]
MSCKKTLFFILFSLSPSLLDAEEDAVRPFYMGFTPFPYDISQEAVDDAYRFVRENGDIIAHHLDSGVPWTESLDGAPYSFDLERNWDRRVQASAGRKIFVSVTPMNGDRKGMALYWGEKENMPLPETFQNKPFDDPLVKKAYLNYCRRAIKRLKPDYLAIGIEVNELFHNAPAQWAPFLDLYRSTYTELKKENPALPIFATFTLHNLRNEGWSDVKAQQEEIKAFLQYCDVVGISYYPFMIGNLDHANADLDWLRSFTDKPIAIGETGYPGETIHLKTFHLEIPGSPDSQAKYYQTLFQTAQRDRYLFIVSFLSRDYDALWDKIKASSPEAFVVWKDCGLLDEKGTARPVLSIWRRYFSAAKK